MAISTARKKMVRTKGLNHPSHSKQPVEDDERPHEVVKFVLLSHGRTGSTLLSLALGKHPNIRMFLELFHEDREERERSFRADGRTYQDGEDAAQFLREAVFYPRYWKPLRAVGFKLFYEHARQNSEDKKVWHYLKTTKDVRIIHLVRRNLLESWLSYETALRTDVWTVLKGEAEPPPALSPFTVDIQKCENFFRSTEKYRDWARQVFRGHPFIEVEYESDLCEHFQKTMNLLHDFLDVPRYTGMVLTKKQARHKPCQQIINYNEMKRYFAQTSYAEFFDSSS
jgi:LPS sulfotransferase NodH